MSTTAAAYPIVAALKAAETFLGPGRRWEPANGEQERFLTDFFAHACDEAGRIPEIESVASREADEIARFLAERGLPIPVAPLTEGRFGVASVLDLLVEWVRKGTVTEVVTEDGQRYPGVQLGDEDVAFLRARRHPNPIARLETKSGDAVYLTMLGDPPEGLELIARAQELSRRKQEKRDFVGLVFPMVDLDQVVDASWLAGLATVDEDGSPWQLEQALQRSRLRMNEVGARAESAFVAVAAVAVGWEPPPIHVIDRPFLVWFERDGLSRPLFVAHVTEEDWRNPGDLDRPDPFLS